jgi:hypothetical protein
MAIVLRVEVSSQVDDRPQSNAAPQGRAVPRSNPLQDGSGTDEGVSRCASEVSEVTENALVILQLISSGSAIGKVGIDSCIQHDIPSGQGWAIWPRSSRSTLA